MTILERSDNAKYFNEMKRRMELQRLRSSMRENAGNSVSRISRTAVEGSGLPGSLDHVATSVIVFEESHQ